MQADLVWLVVIAVLNSAVSAYYYISVIRTLFKTSEHEEPVRTGLAISAVSAVAAVGVVFFGIVPGPLFDAARSAAEVFART